MGEETPNIIESTRSLGVRRPPTYKEFENFEPVDNIVPKRCYVVSQVLRKMDRGKSRYMSQLSPEEFQERLRKAKDEVLALSEEKLDELILSEKYPKRLKAYNSVRWYRGVVYPDEVGVWRRAGGLPIEWTEGSLMETAERVAQAIQGGKDNKVAARAKRAIPRIQEHLTVIERDEYLYPIILPGATEGRGRNGRPYKGFQVMKGDIDDGCMRAISFIVSGRTSFHAYIGVKQ